MNTPIPLIKIVVRDSNGKVVQIHERYESDFETLVINELRNGYSCTITRLIKQS